MPQTVDKRKNNRVKTKNLKILYKTKGAENSLEGEVINISSGGICFIRNSIIQKGDIISIKFPFKSKKVIMTGEIIRINGREVGVKFNNTEDEKGDFIDIFNYEYPLMKKGSKPDEKLFLDNNQGTYNKKGSKNFDDFLDIDS